MTIVYHMLIAGAGVVGLMLLWVAVQAVVRRQSPGMTGDEDVLACRSCGTPDACGECAHAHRPDQRAARAVGE